MEGLSETLLKNHFTLYQGYVTNTNKLIEILGQMAKEGKAGTPELAELKRRFGSAAVSMASPRSKSRRQTPSCAASFS